VLTPAEKDSLKAQAQADGAEVTVGGGANSSSAHSSGPDGNR
jgi:cell division protease FtsH